MALSETGVGVAVAVVASAIFEVSYVLQALEARRVATVEAPQVGLLARLARRPLWAGAIVLSIVAFSLQVLALRHAPLSLVQPVLALGLAFMLVLAHRVLHERVGRRELIGAAGIVVGVSLIVVAGPERGAAHHDTGLAIACGLLALVAAAPYIRRTRAPAVLVAGAVAGDALAALAANEVARELGSSVPAAAGWAAAAGVAAIVALTSETTALQRSPATTVAPIVLAGQIAVPAALAPLVAGDRWGATPLGGGLVVVGLALVVAATVVLGRSPAVGRVHHPDAVPA